MRIDPGLPVILMGLKHSGKSTLARMLAQARGTDAEDLDLLAAVLAVREEPAWGGPREHQAVVRAYYRARGKEAFQELEARAAAAWAATAGERPGAVLALGGGTMENPLAMEELRGTGRLVFLDAPEELLFERIMRGGLPAFLDAADPRGSFGRLYAARRSLALEHADLVVTLGDLGVAESFKHLASALADAPTKPARPA